MTQEELQQYKEENNLHPDLSNSEVKELIKQKIKDAPNSYMKRKYMIELQEMKKKEKKDKPVSLLRGTSKMIIKKGKPTIK